MTREEAVARIKDHIEVHHIKENRAIKIVQALNMAIEALEASRWHYLTKGELPEKDGEYLCRYYKYDLRFSKVSFYRVEDNKWYNLVYDEEYRVPKPDAWQYIILPKEEV